MLKQKIEKMIENSFIGLCGLQELYSLDSYRISLSIETSALQVRLSFSFLSLLQCKYLSANPGILSLCLVWFYYLSRSAEFPQGFLYLFSSSFHYKLRLLMLLLTTVSKYSTGGNLISLGVKNVQFY